MGTVLGKTRAIGIAGVILFVLGVFGWQGLLHGGPDMLELTESAQWGLLVAMFFFFEALGSGFLLVGALRGHVGSLVVGVAGVLAACVIILMDLYHPVAGWRLFLAPNVGSPMFLDMLFSALCIIFGVFCIVLLRGKSKALSHACRVVVGVLSILFPLGTSWLCTTLPGQWGWSPLEVASFFTAVAVCAGAAATVFKMERGRVALCVALAISFLFIVADAGFLLYGEDTATTSLVNREVVIGRYAPLFWITTLAFVAVPAVLALCKRVDGRIVAAVAVLGVALSKYLFAVKGNLFPYVMMPDVKVQLLGTASGLPVSGYVPCLNEWVALVGGIGLFVAIVAFALPRLATEVKTRV